MSFRMSRRDKASLISKLPLLGLRDQFQSSLSGKRYTAVTKLSDNITSTITCREQQGRGKISQLTLMFFCYLMEAYMKHI